MELPQHTRDVYCETSERVESDYLFPPNDEAALVSELQRVQNHFALQDSVDSSERPHHLVNFHLPMTLTKKSNSINQMGILQMMIPSMMMIIRLVKWFNKHFRVSDNVSSIY